MAKLEQKTVDDGCMAAYERYAAMPIDKASLAFSYELQGWAKYMVSDHDATFGEVCERVIALLDLLVKANEPNPRKFP